MVVVALVVPCILVSRCSPHRVCAYLRQLVEEDDIADPKGPKVSMLVDNNQPNIVDYFMDFTLREGSSPNFYLPVGELYMELPARSYVHTR